MQQTDSKDIITLILKSCLIKSGIRLLELCDEKSDPCNVPDAVSQSAIHPPDDDQSNTTQSEGQS